MRHRVHGRKLGRTSAHRKALFRNQLTALFTHERIITTIAKAKELRPIAERMVTLARNDTLAARRKVATMVQDKEIAKRLFDEIAPRFADRPGGYTRIMRLGRRHGDNAEIAIIEFVDYELADHQDGGEGDSKDSFLDRAKGVFGGGAAAETAADETTEEASADTPDAGDEPIEAETVTDDAEVVEAEAVAEEPVEEIAAEDSVEAAADEPIADEPAEEPEAASETTDEAVETDEAEEDEKKDA